MSISDKFLGIFRVKDEDYDDDYYDDYEDEYEDIPQPRTASRRKPKQKAVPDLDEEDYEDEEDDFDDDEPVVKKSAPKKRSARNNKVVQLNSRTHTAAEVCVIKPQSVEDANEVSDTLLQGKAVILNLYGLDVMISQRIIDFSGGTCYAIGGNLKKVKDDIFVISPPSIDISGDIQELPNGDFDMSSITAKKLY
ncbi:MAG: cell division protein SepF [Lachnospiraceae bacterium]|nr:cell division protein SepF [Lachnospiraceae bacterium]